MMDEATARRRLAELRGVPIYHIRINTHTHTTYTASLCDAEGAPVAHLAYSPCGYEGLVRAYEHEIARTKARDELRRMIDAQKRDMETCHAGQRAAAAPELS